MTIPLIDGPRVLFVYGTLRRDLSPVVYNTHVGQPRGLAWLPKAVMYANDLFPYVFRWPINSNDPPEVTGQLISYTNASDEDWKRELQRLDNYEGALFKRQIVTVKTTTGAPVRAQCYLATRPWEIIRWAQRVPSGDWRLHKGVPYED